MEYMDRQFFGQKDRPKTDQPASHGEENPIGIGHS